MENVLKTILNNNLVSAGDVVAVACSGGADSMALLHKLKSLESQLNIEVIAVTINHQIRINGKRDANFVEDYCASCGIRCYKFNIDVPLLAKQKALSLESAARQARYAVFDALVQKRIANKIALAHHVVDQAETILMHIFRGSGLSGARGMDYKKDAHYIRPLLNTSKKSVLDYIQQNNIPHVEDETNFDSVYTRNYLRNEVFPILLKKWPNLVSSLINFSRAVSEDDDFINKNLNDAALIIEDKTAKIPLSYFNYDNAVINRIIFKALHGIGINVDIERKHIEIIKDLAKNSMTGKKVNLPLDVTAFKEYEYITLVSKKIDRKLFCENFSKKQFSVPDFGSICVKRVTAVGTGVGELYIDEKKLPKGAVWRYRASGDVFEKFGGGTKKLKSYLIDKKIPQRERDFIPVLAVGNEVYIIAGLEISNKVKIDDNSKSILKIEVKKL